MVRTAFCLEGAAAVVRGGRDRTGSEEGVETLADFQGDGFGDFARFQEGTRGGSGFSATRTALKSHCMRIETKKHDIFTFD